MALADLTLGHRRDLRELDTVVDLQQLSGVGELVGLDRPLVATQDRQHVGEVELALGVVGADVGQRLQQRLAVEGEHAGAHLPDVELELGRIARCLRLDDALDGPVGSAHDPSVATGIVEGDGHERGGGPGALMGLRERPQRRGGDERRVAVDHDHRVGTAEVGNRGAHGARGSVVLRLHGDLDSLTGERLQRS